jgi:hypothetical protein
LLLLRAATEDSILQLVAEADNSLMLLLLLLLVLSLYVSCQCCCLRC